VAEELSTTEMADILKEQNKILEEMSRTEANQPAVEQPEVEQPINPVTTDDLDFFLYSNPNLII
jgi:hypothetical protein